jgi:NitT/TauT family transport system ATP-binding protein
LAGGNEGGRSAAEAGRPRSAQCHVALRGIEKRYRSRTGETAALERVDLAVGREEFVSVLGPSGCGKSTLLMIAAGLVPPSSGTVEIDDRRVTAPVTDIGIVFQRDLLFDWRTVLGNVLLQADIRRMNRNEARTKALALLGKAGLAGFEESHPWELSGGMRQRVSICRALLHEAPLLLMDEPFGALDSLTRDQMVMDLQRLWMADRRTVIFVTHNIAEAVFLSDRIIVMSPRPGRIVAEIAVDLARPRSLDVYDNPSFVAYQHEIRRTMERLDVLR